MNKVNDTTYKIDEISSKGLVEIEIGDSKQPEFYPQVKFKQWENEANFSIRYIDKESTATESVEEIADKVVWSKGQVESHLYPLDIDEDGGFEFEVVFKEKPKTNIVEFSIETKDLDFFYQPRLTEEDIFINGCDRSEEVEGSYAIYHKTQSGNYVNGKNYVTGKFAHIYRPYVEDATGNAILADVNIDLDNKLLKIIIPQDFLDTAIYPIIVDPTVGYTSVGASETVAIGGTWGALVTPDSSGTVTSMSAYLSSFSAGTGYLDTALYTHSDLALVANSQVTAVAIGYTTDNNAWKSISFSDSPSITASTDYLIGVVMGLQTKGSPNFKFRYDSGSALSHSNSTSVFSSGTDYTFPSTFPTVTHNDYKLSIYATYTASGGSESLSPSLSISLSPSVSVSRSISLSPSVSVSLSISPSPSLSPSSSQSPSSSESVSISLSISPSPSVSISLSPSVSVSLSSSISVSLSPSSSASPSASPSLSPSSSSSASISPSSSISLSISLSGSLSLSLSPSLSISPSPSSSVSLSPSPSSSISLSISLSPSVSVSLSISPSPSSSQSPSLSISLSPSSSVSLSPSPSSSVSLSPSPSPSLSPSLSPSVSESVSISLSPSVSVSLSISPSPSIGYSDYTRGNYALLPTDDVDLETNYSAQDVTDVATDDGVRVGQVGIGEYMIHQFKKFIVNNVAVVIWNGQSNLAPTVSTIYLQIYNYNSAEWETLDSNNSSSANTDFDLSGLIPNLTDYKNAGKIATFRVYQLSI